MSIVHGVRRRLGCKSSNHAQSSVPCAARDLPCTATAVAATAAQASLDAHDPYPVRALYRLMASVTRLNPCGPRFPLPSDAVCAAFVGTSSR